MFRCPHVQWLDLDRAESRWTLTDPGRLRSVIDELPNPERQCPSVVFFVGKRCKTVALRNIYTSNNVTRRKAHGVGNLLFDVQTHASEHPILFADCTPRAPCTSLLGQWGACHENRRHTICRSNSELEDVVALVHANLVFPFTHVVCVFADDLGGNRACASYVEGLLGRRAGRPGNGSEACPHLLAITTNSTDLDDLVQVEGHDNFHSMFESFQILTVDQTSTSSTERLKMTLRHVIDDARQQRQERHLLFSAIQLANVFTRAAEMFSQDPTKSVDLLASSQHPARSLPAEDVANHLQHFLSLSIGCLPQSSIVEHIASALAVQGYPPGTHRGVAPQSVVGFSPQLIFEEFFDHILKVVTFPVSSTRGRILCGELVWQKFSSFFDRLGATCTAHDLRRKVLLRHKLPADSVNTRNLCLSCLVRPPERAVSCGHSVCEECLAGYYAPGHNAYTYVVDRCLPCNLSIATVLKIKPPTMMPSLLGFDGGGVRGIVELILTKRLQDALDVPYPFWEFFHSVVGTSVGGVIALDMVVTRSSIDETLARFKHWVTKIFPVKRYRWLPHCQKLRDFLIWLIRDSKHDSRVLEAVMEEAFGKNERLFDATAQHWSGTRLGIMAATTLDSQLRIFTNYNGLGRGKHDIGYRIIRPTRLSEEPSIKKVARVTVAAPGYFEPYDGLHDGGLRANNPIEAGLWELGLIWPGHARPGLVLSVGTGYQGSPAHELGSDRHTDRRGIWFDTFVPRVYRAFLSSPCLHGQNSWVALLNRVEEHLRGDFFRLNLEFVGKESALDDSAQIPQLCNLAMDCALDLKAYRNAIWASAFFYELREIPQLRCGYYTCRGTIYCGFQDVRPLLRAIQRVYPGPKLVLDDRVIADFGTDRDYCSDCGLFQQRTEFEARHLTTTINLTLGYEQGVRRHLSSFPNTIQWIIDQQSKQGQFKTWHAIGKHPCCGPVRKRTASWTTGGRSKKRRVV